MQKGCYLCVMAKLGVTFLKKKMYTCVANIPYKNVTIDEKIVFKQNSHDGDQNKITSKVMHLKRVVSPSHSTVTQKEKWQTLELQTPQVVEMVNSDWIKLYAIEQSLAPSQGTKEPPSSNIIKKSFGIKASDDLLHKVECQIPSSPPLKNKRSFKIAGFNNPSTFYQNVVIYAPPGYGKTMLQAKGFTDEVILTDTDDVSVSTSQQLRTMLVHASVLTNRIELLTDEMPAIMFIPSHKPTFVSRVTSKTNVDTRTAEKWYGDINESASRFKNNKLICKTHDTYVLDWLTIKNKSCS